jgi:hypothetical protein
MVAYIVAGADGVNVRTGPATSFTRIGYLDPGAQANVFGKYADWWEIAYEGGTGWVFGDIVTAYNTDSVPDVQPPPSPTAAPVAPTVAPTAVPPTVAPTTAPPTIAGGIQGLDFSVEDAPGPFGAAHDIWFNFSVRNTNQAAVTISGLGVYVQDTSQFQQSWSTYVLAAGETIIWRDHINQFGLGPGTYSLWLRVCFPDGGCADLRGPIAATIQ